jgi:hypothetical protein
MADVGEIYPSWDPLREQEWESLGVMVEDSFDHDSGLGWDGMSPSVSGDSEMPTAPSSHDMMDTDVLGAGHRPSKVISRACKPCVTSSPRAVPRPPTRGAMPATHHSAPCYAHRACMVCDESVHVCSGLSSIHEPGVRSRWRQRL